MPALAAILGLMAFALAPARSESTGQTPSIPGDAAIRSSTGAAQADPGQEARRREAAESYGQIPLTFVPNRGQADHRIRYSARGAGVRVAFTPEEVILVLGESGRERLGLRFPGADPDVRIRGEQEAPGKVNYLIGSDPAGWKADLPTYREVRYSELWPGVDLVFRGAPGALKYDFVLRPGARVEAIRLAYRGAEGLRLDGHGNLQIRTAGGTLTDERPVSWQEIGGRRAPVTSRYVLHGAGSETECGFVVGPEYDPSRPLIIDPTLSYGTYLGGKSNETGWVIAVNAANEATIAGWTSPGPSLLPTTPGAYDRTINGPWDGFVTRLNSSGTGLVFSTYIGGNWDDWIYGISLDGATGNIGVVGTTGSSNFPSSANAFDTSLGGPEDVFVAVLNPTGSALVYGSYLGGSGDEEGVDIAFSSGTAWVAGWTASTDFPVAGAFDSTLQGARDNFVARIDPAAASGPASLLSSSYLGGSADEEMNGIAVDSGGEVYVIGYTSSADFLDNPEYAAFGLAAGAYDPVLNPWTNGYDAFLAIVHADGSGLKYGTFRGGASGVGAGVQVVPHEAGWTVYVYMVGSAGSTFATTPGAYDRTHNGGNDAYLTVLRPDPSDSNPSGGDSDELVYSTFLSGSGNEGQISVAVDTAGNAYIHGQTASSNFPVKNAFDTSKGGATDCFVAKIAPLGGGSNDLIYSSFLGGSKDEFPGGIAVDGLGRAYVTGRTASNSWFPSNVPGYDKSTNGSNDAFVVRVNP